MPNKIIIRSKNCDPLFHAHIENANWYYLVFVKSWGAGMWLGRG